MTRPDTDVTRLTQSKDSLTIILKNTHFSDQILEDSSKVSLHIDYSYPIAVAVIRFTETYYDFIQPLRFSGTELSASIWLDQSIIAIKLVLSDSVITDQLSTVVFQLNPVDSLKLRGHVRVQNELTASHLNAVENQIYENMNTFFI